MGGPWSRGTVRSSFAKTMKRLVEPYFGSHEVRVSHASVGVGARLFGDRREDLDVGRRDDLGADRPGRRSTPSVVSMTIASPGRIVSMSMSGLPWPARWPGESDVADLAWQLRVGVMADALGKHAGADALVDRLGPVGAEPGMRRMAKASPVGGWGACCVELGLGAGAVVAGAGPEWWRSWPAAAARLGRRGRLGAGELALERVDGRRLGAVGGNPDDAELPDDEEQQDGAGGDRQLADDADDRPKSLSRAALSRR